MAYLDEEDDDEDVGSAAEGRGALASTSAGPMSATGKEYLKNALKDTQESLGRQQTTYDKLQQERLQQVQRQREILDGTIEKLMASRQAEGVTPLLAAASGFFAPTRTGGTGESFGNALNRLTPALEHEERQRAALAQQIGNLQYQGSALEGGLLKDRQVDLARQMLAGQKQSGILARALAKAEQGPKQTAIQQMLVAAGIHPGDPRYQQYMQAALNKATERAPGRLYQIPDDTSPTGFRYATGAEAAGKGAMGPSGLVLETDPETGKLTGVKMGAGVTNPKGAAPGLTPTSTTAVEKEMLKAGDQLMKITAIEDKFDPKFHEWGEQIQNWWTATREKGKGVLPPPSPELKKNLDAYTGYLRDATSTMAEIRHDLFGASLTKGEQESAKEFILTSKDSPTEAASKIKGFKELTRKVIARNAYIKQHGLTINDVALERMPVIIRARGNQLERDLIEQGLEGEQLKTAIKSRLAQEFGLGG